MQKKRAKPVKKFKNRFQKFYYLNKDRINKKRRLKYKAKKTGNKCVRCSRKALKSITVCTYHRQKQKEYNANR